MAQLEIACFNLDSALIAAQNGADRIELCAAIEAGGTTPHLEDVQQARNEVTIDLYVMIRPRGGNFVYTELEVEQMKSDILEFKKHGIDGFVFGILNEDDSVDFHRNKALVDLAYPIPCTFHRAFDEVLDAFESLEQIIRCGFKTILTSGQKPNVTEGVNQLAQLTKAAGDRIVIMPGGGLRSGNVGQIRQETGAVFYHSSAITDGGETASAEEVRALKLKLE